MKTQHFLTNFIKKTLVYGSLFLALSLAIDYYRKPSEAPQFATQVLIDNQNQPKIIAQLSYQKPLVLYFWGSWCHFCQFTSPAIQQLQDDGISVLGVALRSGNITEVNRYLSENHYTFPTINDPQGTFADQWNIQVTPTILIIQDGKVKNHTTGLTSYWGIKTRLWLAKFF